jgi:hypothetical protein
MLSRICTEVKFGFARLTFLRQTVFVFTRNRLSRSIGGFQSSAKHSAKASRLISRMMATETDGTEVTMDLHLSLGPSEKLRLAGAILVNRGAHQSFAAWHRAIVKPGRAPTLGEAEPLSTEFQTALSAGLEELTSHLKSCLPLCCTERGDARLMVARSAPDVVLRGARRECERSERTCLPSTASPLQGGRPSSMAACSGQR